jgi:hypothetical protein
MEIEIRSTRSNSVENSLWTNLWTCRKKEHRTLLLISQKSQKIWAVRYHVRWRLHVRLTNQPTIMVAVLLSQSLHTPGIHKLPLKISSAVSLVHRNGTAGSYVAGDLQSVIFSFYIYKQSSHTS